MPKKSKKAKKDTSAKQQPPTARPQPPRFMRSRTNVQRFSRGSVNFDQQNMMRSVVNSLSTLPQYLQRHVDDRFAMLDKRAANEEFKRDEVRRSVPVDMDVQKPVEKPDTAMSEPPSPVAPPPDIEMQQVRDPLMHRSMRPIRYTPPTRLSIRTHSFIPTPQVQTRDMSTSYFPPVAGRRRTRDERDGGGGAQPLMLM